MKNLESFIQKLNEQPEDYVTAREDNSIEGLFEKPKPDVDWKKIEEFEGGRTKNAYVPNAGKSGVTVGAGFDIGQQQNLEGLKPSIADKLSPYLGLQRAEAAETLKTQPLELSPEEAGIVTEYAQNNANNELKRQWEQISDVPFESLTPAQKTVLQSVQYQYGKLSRTPRFAQFAGKGQWENVVKELRNFKDNYPTRRGKEADYLEASLKKK